MIVCIAEKPSVGREIAAALGATTRRDGYMEGNGYQVTWTFGHLCELKAPAEYTPLWERWSLAALPMLPARFGIRLKATDQGIEHQFEVIKSLFAAADMIVNCGDAGQEGELIQRWVLQLSGAKCPVKRLWINSLTTEAIKEGFARLVDQSNYQSLYEAGLSRAIGDWLLGMNATRAYTLRYRSNGAQKQVLSIGRVQTPTLAMIVRRQDEIDNFEPTPYWVLATVYKGTTFTAVMDEGQRGFSSEAEGQQAIEAIRDEEFRVTKAEKKKGTEAPPRLFDLTSLQVECNKRYDMPAEVTLQTIQSLYEKKLTTYPRVDTTYLPDDVYPKCKQILNGMPAYFPLMERIKGKALAKSKKVFDNKKVTDHHAIIPTGQKAQGLSDLEEKVYDLVARRFIGAFYPDLLFEQTTVLGQVGDITFRATGKHVTDPGWKALWSEQGTEEKLLPAFAKGEHGPHEPTLTSKQTTPPKPYTEATLLRAMETAGKTVDDEELRDAMKENGIGRPSTRAAIIETLFSRRYIERRKKNLAPTEAGRQLIGLISTPLLTSAELTGQWERKLRLIEAKQYDAARFIGELKEMASSVVQSVLEDQTNRRI